MVNSITAVAAAASLLFLPTANAFYASSSPVIQANAKTYDSIVNKSNYTSIVEFYAPWCGHCKNLKPAYEKAAKSLTGLAKVVAVNCDEEANKPLCGSMGVQGFPTLKLVRPGKKPGKPAVEDYQGGRTAKAIVDAVIEKIPNHVKRLKNDDYAAWVDEGTNPKALLFSNKGTVSALLKSLAIDFLGALDIAQVRDKETKAVEAYGVENFPTLVLIPGKGKEPITYDGEIKKEPMVKFLSQAATPNPDPPKNEKKKKAKADKKDNKEPKSSAPPKSAESKTATEEDEAPTPEPAPPKPEAQPIQSLEEAVSLQQKCLNDKAGTCVLALLPKEETPSEKTLLAIKSLSELHQKYEAGGRNLFPFYQVPDSNSQGNALRIEFELASDVVEIIAVNGKRGWWRHYQAADFTLIQVEDWVDAIRMGDSPKKKIADGLIVAAEDLPSEPVKVEDPEQAKEKATEPNPESEQLKKMKENLKAQIPEGMEVQLEEIDDDEYEKIMKQGQEQEQEQDHDEL
jgi:protein disulfide-isomerase A6